MVQDQVDLLGQLLVELRDDRLDRLDDVGADQLGLRERLLRQRPDRPLDGFLGFVGLRLEFFSQKRIEFGRLQPLRSSACASCWDFGSAMTVLRSAVHAIHDEGSSCGFFVVASVCSSAGSCSSLLTSSSAPLLPSM